MDTNDCNELAELSHAEWVAQVEEEERGMRQRALAALGERVLDTYQTIIARCETLEFSEKVADQFVTLWRSRFGGRVVEAIKESGLLPPARGASRKEQS